MTERTEIVSIMPDVWDDAIDYFFTTDGEKKVLSRRKCGVQFCKQTTQLELCTNHLHDVGLEVKKSQIPNSGWGLYTTRDWGKGETVSYFTGVESERVKFRGPTEYVAWRGGGFIIDSSIERCSAACANAQQQGNNNCRMITYKQRCYIKTKSPIRSGDEIFIPYGRSYRWK